MCLHVFVGSLLLTETGRLFLRLCNHRSLVVSIYADNGAMMLERKFRGRNMVKPTS